MFRDRDRELRRLEEALLEQEADQQLLGKTEEHDREEGERSQSCSIYNADHTDVDLETYSQQVWTDKRRRSPLSVLARILSIAILLVLVYLFLRFGGYL